VEKVLSVNLTSIYSSFQNGSSTKQRTISFYELSTSPADQKSKNHQAVNTLLSRKQEIPNLKLKELVKLT
jgi:hypothetical protein